MKKLQIRSSATANSLLFSTNYQGADKCSRSSLTCSATPIGATVVLPRSSPLLPCNQAQGRFTQPDAHTHFHSLSLMISLGVVVFVALFLENLNRKGDLVGYSKK